MKSTNQQLRPNILLVHGSADGSIWIPIIERLQLQRFNVVASQMPLTSFEQDVKAVERDLGALKGPTVVVGHTYGGLVITQAASRKTNVASLVYVAGCAFDTNQTIESLLKEYPTPAAKFIVPVDRSETPPFLIMQRDKIPEFACPDVIRSEANAIAATAAPMSATIFSAKITKLPAWKQPDVVPDSQRGPNIPPGCPKEDRQSSCPARAYRLDQGQPPWHSIPPTAGRKFHHASR